MAWVAGVLEGEGCFMLHQPHKDRLHLAYPRVQVGMTDGDVIARLHAATGVGTVNCDVAPRTKNGLKPMHWWRVGRSSDAYAVMMAVLPWMGERRRAKIIEIAEEWIHGRR